MQKVWRSARSICRSLDFAYVILAIGIGALAWMNVQLRMDRSVLFTQLSELTPGLTGVKEIQEGDVVPALTGVTLSGREAAVRYNDSGPQLLLVYDPRCGVCAREAPLWKSLASEAASLGVEVHWVSLATPELTRKGLARDSLAIDPLIMPDMGMQRAYRVASIPQVLLVSSPGRVRWAHHGALSPARQDSLRQALREYQVPPALP